MYRTLGALVAVIVAALLLVVTSFRASVEGRADFTFVNHTEPKTLDPGLMTGAVAGRIADGLFEGLTYRDPRTLRPAPGVAASWDVSEDGRTWTFRLREDARWTDGRTVTAHDFAWSWRRLQEPALGSEYAYILHGLRHAEALNTYRAQAEALRGPILAGFDALRAAHPGGADAATWRRFLVDHDAIGALSRTPDERLARSVAGGSVSTADWEPLRAALLGEATRRDALAEEAERRFGIDEGVFALDDRTLVVELAAPMPYFLDLTAFFPTFPVPRPLVEAHPRDWFLPGRIVGNGPFTLERWQIGDRIRLRRSQTYWNRAEIGIETIDALPVENTTTALNLYLTGAVDWLFDYPNDLSDALRERPDHYSGPAFIVYYYRVNTTRPPFDDARVRRAVALAIDREAIVRDVLGLGQIAAHHIVPPGIPAYDPPPSMLGFDPEQARALLAEAGFPGGAGFPEIGILYNTLESHKLIAELIADQLGRHLGIRVQPYNQEWQAYLATMLAGEYDLARAGWIGDYLDPNTFLDIWVTNGGNNQTGWSDPLYDRLIRAAADAQSIARDPALLDALTEPDRARTLLDALRTAGDPATRRTAAARLRMQLLREAEAILVQRAFPVIPIYFYVNKGMIKPHVRGFYAELQHDDGSTTPNLQDLHPLRGIRVLAGQADGPVIDALVVFAAFAALSATALLPPLATRVLGTVLLAAVAFAAARHSLGDAAGAAVSLALAGAAGWALPSRVMRRVAFLVPSLVVLVLATTWLMYLAPGNPFAQEKVVSPQVEAALRAQYGVPESPLAFFRIYMERLLVDGSLGPALKVQGRTVQELLLPALPVSLSLGLLALVLAVVIGLVLGVRAGLRRGQASDHASMALALVGISLPNFVIGAGLMILFSLQLGWLPIAGWGSFGHLWMPALTLALPYAAYIARLARTGTIEVMQQEFILTARAKGLSERAIVLGHALRGAILPVVSFLGPAAAGILTGSFVVETLFGIPGMGQWFVKGAINRDYSVVLGTAIIYFTLVTAFNLLVDLAYAWLDPRVREEL